MTKAPNKKIKVSKSTLKKLFEQQEKAESTSLKNLLGAEIDAYYLLEDKLLHCLQALEKLQTQLHHELTEQFGIQQELLQRANEVFESGDVKEAIQVRDELLALIDLLEHQQEIQSYAMSITENCHALFAAAVERNPVQWTKIISGIAMIAGKIAINYLTNPLIIIKVLETAYQTAKEIQKHCQQVPDYKTIDDRLLLAEKHIAIMNTTALFFEHVTKEVSDPLCFHES